MIIFLVFLILPAILAVIKQTMIPPKKKKNYNYNKVFVQNKVEFFNNLKKLE